MRLVYCIPSLNKPGGMERVLTTKVNYLSEKLGYEIHIVTEEGDKTNYFPLSASVICHHLSFRNKKEYRKILTQLLYDLKPHITISLFGSEFTFLYKIKDGSKKIVEFHFTKYYLTHLVKGIANLRFRQLHLLKAWWMQKREAFYAAKYDKVVLLTRQDLNLWGNKSNMCYIYNPLSFYSDASADLNVRCIVAAGRLMAQKGFDLLIDAFAKIAKTHLDWRLLIFGDGSDHQFLLNHIKNKGLEQQIQLCPATYDIRKVFLGSSIFAFSSRYEGFGLVLTEAMECGLPCVSFDCECGPREIIENGRTGYLVKSGDVNDFALKLGMLMDDPPLRKKMGSNGKLAVQRFYLDKIMSQWDRLFTQILI